MSARPLRLTRRATGAVLLAATLFVAGLGMSTSVVNAAPTQEDVNRIADELERLEAELYQVGADYDETMAEYESLSKDLQDKIDELTLKESELNAMRGELRQSALKAFMNGGRNDGLASLLTDTGGLTQSVQREYLTGIAMNAGSNQADELDALVLDVTNQRLDLERQQDYAQGVAKQLKQRQSTLDELTAEFRAKKEQAERELGEALAAEQARRTEESNSQYTGSLPAWDGDRSGCKPLEPASPRAAAAIARGCTQLGVPYDKVCRFCEGRGFDCSGFTMYAWGTWIGNDSRSQFASNPQLFSVSAGNVTSEMISKLQPGDLIFYYSPRIGHVGMYLGKGMWIHSPQTGSYVNVSAVTWRNVSGAARPG